MMKFVFYFFFFSNWFKLSILKIIYFTLIVLFHCAIWLIVLWVSGYGNTSGSLGERLFTHSWGGEGYMVMMVSALVKRKWLKRSSSRKYTSGSNLHIRWLFNSSGLSWLIITLLMVGSNKSQTTFDGITKITTIVITIKYFLISRIYNNMI